MPGKAFRNYAASQSRTGDRERLSVCRKGPYKPGSVLDPISRSGFGHQPSAAAVVVGPTGLAFDPAHDTLYVASTVHWALRSRQMAT